MRLSNFAELLVKRPKTVLLVFTIITFMVGSQVANLYMVSDMGVYLPKNEPTVQLLDRIEQEWSLGSTIIIYVEGSDVLDLDVLKDIDKVTQLIDPYRHDEGKLDGVITSTSIVTLIKQENSLPYPFGTGKYELPGSEYQIKRYVAELGNARKTLLTDDLTATAITFVLRNDIDADKILAKAEDAISNVHTKMTLIGTLPMNAAIKERSIRNMAIIFPLAVLFTAIVIMFFHRDLKGLLIVFLPPIYSIILTFGFLGVFAPELTMISIAIVALLIGLGVDYSIHLMNRFTEESSNNIASRVEKILRTTGKAVLLSTATTMIGFSSLMISAMPPMINFGLGCTVGILFSFISTVVMVPPLLAILKFEKKEKVYRWKRLAGFAIDNSERILLFGCIIAVLSLMVLPQVGTDVNYYELAPKDEMVIEKTMEFSERFGMSGNLDIILVEGDLKDPEVLKAIDDMEEKMRDIGISAYSVVDGIKRINLGRIPERGLLLDNIYPILIKQGMAFVDEKYSKTLISLNVPSGLSIDEYTALVQRINEIIDSTNIPDGHIYHVTGATAINVAINNILFEQQIRSLFISLLFVFAALIIIFRSSLYALLTMIPIGFVLVWEPGILVTLDISLSVITIVIASIIVGTGIDYGIHITQRLREELRYGLKKREAVKKAIEKTGLSLVEAALTTVAGLLAVYFVNVPALQSFVKVIIAMILLSLVGAVFILPAFYRLKMVK